MFPGNKPHCPSCGCHFSFGHEKNADGSTLSCDRYRKVHNAIAVLLARAQSDESS